MSEFFYTVSLILYRAGIFITSFWNKKAKLWLSGRKKIFEKISSAFETNKAKIIWVHCSSLGEFEQGRPLIESLKIKYPDTKLLLTFFSPSGYEVRKSYKGAEWVFYLPADSKANAKKFLDLVNPVLVVFVKYDYWYYYLLACKKRNIPLLLISAIFRKDQPFFQWYGSLHRKMLNCFTHLFVQEETSINLLTQLNITNVTLAGDTRFDSVTAILQKRQLHPEIEFFCGKSNILIAGSTWPDDERLIKEISSLFPEMKIIIAPHEIHTSRLNELKKLFPASIFFSELSSSGSKPQNSNYLIIDNIGMLSSLYSYATITYIGGGFNQGIHNVLEAAVYGKPVIFGPKFEKFQEAVDLKKSGAGFSISDKSELGKLVSILLIDQKVYKTSCENAKTFVLNNIGATEKILQYIQENRLLTN